MTRLLDLFRLIPRSGKILSLALIIGGAIYVVYTKWGLMPAIFLAGGVGLIFLLVFLYNKMLKANEKQSGAAFGKAINASQQGASKSEIRSAVDAIGEKWQEAVDNLKGANLDLYTLPWYMLIGEPQSGKSTTLRFSGLKFPVGMEAISGGGGTRNCDWWFTEQGVILDTAGRFTFQEDSATDSAEWNHFLTLLAKHRPYCPVNGILLVIPVTSLLGDTQQVRMQKAKNISEKLHSIQQKLAIQFPIFVLITKCDTVYGFTEFFNKLNVDQQREMFGWSNPVLETGFNLETFDKSFGEMTARMDQIRQRNLSRPHYSDDANKTFVFPEEFNALYQPLREYMSVIFESSVYRAPLYFRGYYMTSGMQEGKPIASACSALLQKGANLPDLESVFSKSRAFFIRDFYTEKLFPEEGLVQRAYHHVKRDKMKKRLILGLNATLLLLGVLLVFFMHRSLSKRLDEPKRAIDASISVFQNTQGTFFNEADDREKVFTNLMDLKGAIAAGQEGSFLLFLKGRQNELTAKLQDTFSYMYLDKVLDGCFESATKQLEQFSLDQEKPIPSDQELSYLLDALKEAVTWKYMVKEGRETDFEPRIKPLLNITVDPSWDNELASHRGELAIKDRLELWFNEVYQNSSPNVKKAVIHAWVRRLEGVFSHLHLSAAKFYENQHEMALYKEKRLLLAEIQEIYEQCQVPGLGPTLFHERLMDLVPYFDEVHREKMKPEGDQYLTLSQITQQTLDTLGPAFKNLADPDTKVSSSDRKWREELPEVVTFCNQLIALDPKQYPDPRGEFNPRDEEALSYSEELQSFYDLVIRPYTEEFLDKGEQMNELPLPGQKLEESLDMTFKLGGERAALNKNIFRNNAFKHSALMADERARLRFEEALDDFYKAQNEQNQRQVLSVIGQVVDPAKLTVPEPNSGSWSGLLRQFDQLTENGRDFDEFLGGPNEIYELLRLDYRRQITQIFPDDENLLDWLQNYLKNAETHLGDFQKSLSNLNNIPSGELASRRSYYRGNITEKEGILNLTNFEPEDFPLMVVHRNSLETWKQAALDAWADKVGAADPCPDCHRDWRTITQLVRKMENQFPLTYQGVTKEQSSAPGRLELRVDMADPDDLKELLDLIESYDQASGIKADYIKNRFKRAEFDALLAWCKFVRGFSQQSLSYKLQRDNSDQSITTSFAFCDLNGYYKARRLSFNSPSFRTIEVNPERTENNISAQFTLLNDTDGNRAQSDLIVQGSQQELFAFALADSEPTGNNDVIQKEIRFNLPFGDRQASGLFHFKFASAAVSAPNWNNLLR